MKRLIPILVLLISLSCYGQRDGKMNERIKAQKVAFITDKLNLTPEEASKFWPIYNASEERIETVRNEEMRAIKSKVRQNPDLSEKEADKLLQDLIAAEDKMYRAKLDLINNLKGVIPSKKIIHLKRVEDEFNRILLQRLKEMRQKRGNRN